MQAGFQSLMEPGYSEKSDEKKEEESISGMKPGLLIQAGYTRGPGKKHAHSPSAEAPAGKGPFRLHPLAPVDETIESLFPFVGGGKFHTASGP